MSSKWTAEVPPLQSFFPAAYASDGILVRLRREDQQTAALLDLEQVLRDGLAEQLLSPAEQNYFARFKYPKRRREWLGGRIAAKAAMLQADFPQQARQLTILPDACGRPTVQGLKEDIALSISHSDNHAVALAVKGRNCGIDLQEISDKLPALTDHFASAAELELLAARPACGSQAARLTMLWAAKEAVKKSVLFNRPVIFSGVETERIAAAGERIWQFDCRVQDCPPQTAIIYDFSPHILAVTVEQLVITPSSFPAPALGSGLCR